jgi:hypothetical protein
VPRHHSFLDFITLRTIRRTGYRLVARGSFPGRGEKFTPLHKVQTGSGALPASYALCIGGSLIGGKAAPPCSAEVKNSGAKPPLPHIRSRSCAQLIKHWDSLTFTFSNLTLCRWLLQNTKMLVIQSLSWLLTLSFLHPNHMHWTSFPDTCHLYSSLRTWTYPTFTYNLYICNTGCANIVKRTNKV